MAVATFDPYARAVAHAYLADPENAALSRMVAHMAAMNLQMIDCVRLLVPAGVGNDVEGAR